jgi:hypothetical protein
MNDLKLDTAIKIAVLQFLLVLPAFIVLNDEFTKNQVSLRLTLPAYAQEDSGNSNRDNLCNKLFEFCEEPPSDETTTAPDADTSSDDELQESIAEKYFDKEDTQVPTESTVNESVDVNQPLNQLNGSQFDTEFQTFDNSTLGVSMIYPSDWRVEQGNSSNYLENVLVSPPDSSGDSYLERASIKVTELTSPISLNDFTNRTLESLRKLGFFNIVDSGPTTLSENPAYRVIGVRAGNQTINVIDEWTVKDSRIYRITYTLEEAKSDIYFPKVLEMHDSFRITR